MIGAGQYQYQSNPNQQAGMYPGMYQGQYQGPTFQPTLLPSSPLGSNMNINLELTEMTTGVGLLQAGGMLGGLANQIMNHSLAGKAMTHQADIAGDFYATQRSIANGQREVGMKQMEVVDNDSIRRWEGLEGQQRHEKEMEKLKMKTETRLERIKQDAQTDRAKILSVSDAFRRDWFRGLPA